MIKVQTHGSCNSTCGIRYSQRLITPHPRRAIESCRASFLSFYFDNISTYTLENACNSGHLHFLIFLFNRCLCYNNVHLHNINNIEN